MSTACLRWTLNHAARGVCGRALNFWGTASGSVLLSHKGRHVSAPLSWGWSPLSTTVVETGEGQVPKKNKKQDFQAARGTIGSIGRKIHQRHLQVISETGENMGTMHRADVLRLMDEMDLKLVPLNENKDPPVYQLMTGKQIHEEQLRLREKKKAKTGPVQVKELTMSSDIGNHDLLTKLKQIQTWLDKKHHVRVTLRTGRVEHTQPLDTSLEQMVLQVKVPVGFVSKPKVIQDGRAAMCILRPPSEKEIKETNKGVAVSATNTSLHPANADDPSNASTIGPTPDSQH